MELAWISLSALLTVIVVSCVSSVNPGLLAIALAWVIGTYVAPAMGMPLDAKAVAAGFPTELFITLTGVTLLFAQAQVNGTLDRLSRLAVRGCRGNAGVLPVMFFFLALGISTIGPGTIAAAAMVAPPAMAVAHRAGIPAFLMALMVGHGAVAGTGSPLNGSGIVMVGELEKMGLAGIEWRLYLHTVLAHTGVAFAGFLLFGGRRLFRPAGVEQVQPSEATAGEPGSLRLTRNHWITLAVTGAMIIGVVAFRIHIGLASFAGVVILTMLGAAEEKLFVAATPWSVILMVCGVSLLTALLARTGGLALFSSMIAHVSDADSITGVMGLVTGLVSVYASTMAVVLPTFLPMTPGLAERLGADPSAIAASVVIGGSLVDVSPLSTIGAICVASAAGEDRRLLFNKVLLWGLSMAVVGAGICRVFL